MNQKNPKCGTFGLWDTEGPNSVPWGTSSPEWHHFQASQSVKVKAKVSLCRQEQPTKISSLEDTFTVVQGMRYAPSQFQENGAASHNSRWWSHRSVEKAGREARTWIPRLSSHPQSHSPSSGSWLSSSSCSLLPLTQGEQNLQQGWNRKMQTTLLIFKNKYKRKKACSFDPAHGSSLQCCYYSHLRLFHFLSCQQERSNTEMFYATETKRYWSFLPLEKVSNNFQIYRRLWCCYL